jgi:hypothetical protein
MLNSARVAGGRYARYDRSVRKRYKWCTAKITGEGTRVSRLTWDNTHRVTEPAEQRRSGTTGGLEKEL